MSYKLYIKTHSVTGLKYLGFTAKEDAHKYTGSGFHWRKHLKVHGKYYTTEILLETDDLQLIREQGTHYSQLWDIVKSDHWANEKPETGPGVIPTPAMVQKQLETKRQNGTLNVNTPESVARAKRTRELNNTTLKNPVIADKMRATKQKNGTLNANTPETVAKTKASKAARGIVNGKNPDLECLHCHKVISLGNHNRWHGDRCKLLV
jgi:hypothetical protein